MNDTMLVSLHVFGVVTIVAGLFAVVRNRRPPRKPLARAILFLIGALLAATSMFIPYPLDESHRVLGFPFMTALFEERGSHWVDFVGPLALPALLGNVVFSLLIPHLILHTWRWRARRPTRH